MSTDETSSTALELTYDNVSKGIEAALKDLKKPKPEITMYFHSKKSLDEFNEIISKAFKRKKRNDKV